MSRSGLKINRVSSEQREQEIMDTLHTRELEEVIYVCYHQCHRSGCHATHWKYEYIEKLKFNWYNQTETCNNHCMCSLKGQCLVLSWGFKDHFEVRNINTAERVKENNVLFCVSFLLWLHPLCLIIPVLKRWLTLMSISFKGTWTNDNTQSFARLYDTDIPAWGNLSFFPNTLFSCMVGHGTAEQVPPASNSIGSRCHMQRSVVTETCWMFPHDVKRLTSLSVTQKSEFITNLIFDRKTLHLSQSSYQLI